MTFQVLTKLFFHVMELQQRNNYLQCEFAKLIKQRKLISQRIVQSTQQLSSLSMSIQRQNLLLAQIESGNLDLSDAIKALPAVCEHTLTRVECDSLFKKIARVLNYEINLDQIDKKIKKLKCLPQFKTHTLTTPKLKIAVIMDEFSHTIFSEEAELLQLDIDNYSIEIAQFEPDVLLIESAWFGYKKQWKNEMSIVGPAVFALIRHCSLNRIATALWNKEDPTHFEHFLPLARMVDFVFTTEQECIPRYQYLLGHQRVYLLQFAAQPLLHNPIEKYLRQDKFCFAGAYYYQHPERQDDFDRLISTLQKYKPIKIYDRNFRSLSQYNRPFPDKYKSMIGGKLEFKQIDRAYKGYKYAINLNTVKDADTMCSRRVFELMASNTLMISNWSSGIKNTFGNLVFSSDDSAQLENYLDIVCQQPWMYRKLRLLALREVMQKHTYFERMAVFKSAISGNKYSKTYRPIVVLAKVTKLSEALDILTSFNLQDYPNKRLYLIKKFKFNLKNSNPFVRIFCTQEECIEDLFSTTVENQLLGFFSAEDYYGKYYLLDLVLATRYSSAHAFGKASYYTSTAKKCNLIYDNKQYKPVNSLKLRRCVVRQEFVRKNTLNHWLNDQANAIVNWSDMLGLDEFNYCQFGIKYYTHNVTQLVDDLEPQILAAING